MLFTSNNAYYLFLSVQNLRFVGDTSNGKYTLCVSNKDGSAGSFDIAARSME